MDQLPPDSNPTPIQVFENAGIILRVVMRDGEPWFVAADVCRSLAIGNVADAVGRLDDDEKGVDSIDTPGGKQRASVVSESGLYSLILGSRKPEARAFKRWVTHDVLPSIRRTGSYGERNLLAALEDPATLRNLLGSYAERVQALETENDALRPKATVYDRIVEAPDTYGFREAVKILRSTTGVTERELAATLIRIGWAQRLNKRLAPAHRGEERGYVTARICEWVDIDGQRHTKPEFRITSKGVAKLAEIFAAEVA